MRTFISLIFLILIFRGHDKVLFSKEYLNCQITEELENNKSAKKKLYEFNNLVLFFDLKNEWINDISKKQWLENEKDNFERIDFEFVNDKSVYKFFFKKYYSEKKKNIESSYEIIFDKKTGLMSFPKYYFKNKNELFFSTEIKGICK
tara:strand:- start:1614 stop:2054 length:441 start_codon:yes stop_codon:yes gene_type:complete